MGRRVKKVRKDGGSSSSSVKDSRVTSLKEAIEQDNETIRRLEKKLGFKKRKNAPARCFDEFGLGDVWSIIDQVESKPEKAEENSSKASSKKRKSVEEEQYQREESGDDYEDDDLDSIGDSDDQDNKMDSGDEFKEDIYGRLKDKQGNIVKIDQPKNDLSAKFDSEEIDDRSMKRIRGLLNRLSSCNLMTISTSVEDVLKEYSLFQVTLCLAKCITDQLIQDAFLSPQRLVGEYAMLIAVLNTNIGDEIGGHIVHQFIKQLDNLFNSLSEDNKESIESKRIDNLVAFLSYLYACGMVDSNLIFDLLDKFTQRFDSKCIQVILLTLRMIGFILRKGDPVRLKKMIVDIQCQASEYKSQDQRIGFMLEALSAIKNNNVNKLNSLNEDNPISSIDLSSLRNTVRNGLRAKTSVSCIPGRFEEVLVSNRWWIKSGLLTEESTKKTSTNIDDEEAREEEKTPEESSNSKTSAPDFCDTLATKLRLVTPIRKAVLRSLLTCEDYIECTQRLTKVGGKQFSEIITVCLIVALREKKFNPFYVYLFKQLTQCDRKYKLSLTWAIKDRLNEPDRLTPTEKTNLSRLIVDLMKVDVLPVTILKVFQFNDLSEESVELIKSILIPVFTSSESITARVLSKLKPKDPFTVALRLFISCFMDPLYKEKVLFLKK